MTIEEYRMEIGRLVAGLPDHPYAHPKDYLNKCWALWKDLPIEKLREVVDESIESGKPIALEVKANVVRARLRETEQPRTPMEYRPKESTVSSDDGSIERFRRRNLSPEQTEAMLKEQSPDLHDRSALERIKAENGVTDLWDLVLKGQKTKTPS